jgi:hypothetical protein
MSLSVLQLYLVVMSESLLPDFQFKVEHCRSKTKPAPKEATDFLLSSTFFLGFTRHQMEDKGRGKLYLKYPSLLVPDFRPPQYRHDRVQSRILHDQRQFTIRDNS